MSRFPLQRHYTAGWYTLKRDDAIHGLELYLSKRNGVKNIWVSSCTLTQLEGDKGYEMEVSYQEDLDETFFFPENLDKVIFLDIDNAILPYRVAKVAFATQAGIVITNPSLKDSFYDVGDKIPQELEKLIENANEKGIQIVGITPSISRMQDCGYLFSDMMEYSIREYLYNHPSIKRFIVINREDIQAFNPNLFVGDDIPFGDEEKAKDILNGQTLIKKMQ